VCVKNNCFGNPSGCDNPTSTPTSFSPVNTVYPFWLCILIGRDRWESPKIARASYFCFRTFECFKLTINGTKTKGVFRMMSCRNFACKFDFRQPERHGCRSGCLSNSSLSVQARFLRLILRFFIFISDLTWKNLTPVFAIHNLFIRCKPSKQLEWDVKRRVQSWPTLLRMDIHLLRTFESMIFPFHI